MTTLLLIKVNEAMVLMPGQRCRRVFFMLSMEICSHCATICESNSAVGRLYFILLTIWSAAAVDLELCKGLI